MKDVLRILSNVRLKKFFVLLFFIYVLFQLTYDAKAFELNSKAAVAIEATTGRVLYGKNLNLKLPPASTAKLMTAMVALDKLSLNDIVTISERASQISPIKANFHAGERVSVETLLRAALIKSANDAAYALAEAVSGSEERFAELMNNKALAIGMSDTHFVNSTGLPEEGQYITAYDLAKMLRHALRYPFIREVLNTRIDKVQTENGRTIFLRNSNKLLWEDESVIGGKTGYTRVAKHCFVCASENEGESVIVAVLAAPSREELWNESEALIAKGFNILKGIDEPGVFFDRADYEGIVKKASYKKKNGYRCSKVKAKKKNLTSKKAKKLKKKRLVLPKRQANSMAERGGGSGIKG